MVSAEVVYISTEHRFQSPRLIQIAEHFAKRNPDLPSVPSSNIFVEEVFTVEELWHLVNLRLPTLLARENIRLIVVDSIAAGFRSDFGQFFFLRVYMIRS